MSDKVTERDRYESRAQLLMRAEGSFNAQPAGSTAVETEFRAPYQLFEQYVARLIDDSSKVLEIGAGTGLHTVALARRSPLVTALDISPTALELCRERTQGRVRTICGDMEDLPVRDDSFDIVVSAGSLSYGDPKIVDSEIHRVLKPGGSLLIVDSLNHNPAYRFNRRIQVWRGRRTESTIRRMPTLQRIALLRRGFRESSVDYFGSFVFLHPMLKSFMGVQRANDAVSRLDNRFGRDKFAFKFVLVAQGAESVR